MRALTFQAIGSVAVADVREPAILEPDDAVVRVELTAICGSDLHVFHGRERGIDPGTTMGHEFVGRVEEVGPDVTRIAPGTRVVSPFSTSCGRCYFCACGLTARCVLGQLFGWVQRGVGLEGAQAERVRVPLADSTLVPIGDDLAAASALLLADVLPTGWHCALMGEIRAGATVAVIGCGPVGLMAVAAAMELGAERVFAIDPVPERLAWAARFGASPLRAGADDVGGEIRRATQGRGVDAVLEAVGSGAASRMAFDLVRAGGVVSTAGVHHDDRFAFSPAEAYGRNLTFRIGRCPARSLMEGLIPLVRRRPDLASIVTHRMPLAAGVDGYHLFDSRADGCIKLVLEP